MVSKSWNIHTHAINVLWYYGWKQQELTAYLAEFRFYLVTCNISLSGCNKLDLSSMISKSWNIHTRAINVLWYYGWKQQQLTAYLAEFKYHLVTCNISLSGCNKLDLSKYDIKIMEHTYPRNKCFMILWLTAATTDSISESQVVVCIFLSLALQCYLCLT